MVWMIDTPQDLIEFVTEIVRCKSVAFMPSTNVIANNESELNSIEIETKCDEQLDEMETTEELIHSTEEEEESNKNEQHELIDFLFENFVSLLSQDRSLLLLILSSLSTIPLAQSQQVHLFSKVIT